MWQSLQINYMSLMRLLTVGHSLNGVHSVGRYHIPRQSGMSGFNFGKPARKISSTPPAPPAANNRPAVDEARKRTSGDWLKAANPFATASPKAAAPAAPVQTELTLDKIKVVRNDLNDGDFEVVTRQELPRQAELKPYRKLNKPADVPSADALGAKAWNWLATRLFGAAAKH